VAPEQAGFDGLAVRDRVRDDGLAVRDRVRDDGLSWIEAADLFEGGKWKVLAV
jgi:hypothetical protein